MAYVVCKLSVQKYIFIIHNFNQHNFHSFSSVAHFGSSKLNRFPPKLALPRSPLPHRFKYIRKFRASILLRFIFRLVQGMQISQLDILTHRILPETNKETSKRKETVSCRWCAKLFSDIFDHFVFSFIFYSIHVAFFLKLHFVTFSLFGTLLTLFSSCTRKFLDYDRKTLTIFLTVAITAAHHPMCFTFSHFIHFFPSFFCSTSYSSFAYRVFP